MRNKILAIKYSRLIEDPFPEHSNYERVYGCFNLSMNAPEPINIWEAYKMGYDKAYQEIIDNYHKLKE